MGVCRDGVQLQQSNSSCLLAASPPPALTSNSWAVMLLSPLARSRHLSQISAGEGEDGSRGRFLRL